MIKVEITIAMLVCLVIGVIITLFIHASRPIKRKCPNCKVTCDQRQRSTGWGVHLISNHCPKCGWTDREM